MLLIQIRICTLTRLSLNLNEFFCKNEKMIKKVTYLRNAKKSLSTTFERMETPYHVEEFSPKSILTIHSIPLQIQTLHKSSEPFRVRAYIRKPKTITFPKDRLRKIKN